jgi:hypothetical protein
MLDAHDIQHIKETREQITAHRLVDVILYKQSQSGTDPFTGDPVYSDTTSPAQGTWKSLISQSGGEGEIEFDNGVHVVTDDVILNLDINVDITGLSKVKHVGTQNVYTIKASDPIGLGEPNRHYILLELIK